MKDRRSVQKWRSVADVIHHHRSEQAQEVLTAACQMAIKTGRIEPVLERFIEMPKAS